MIRWIIIALFVLTGLSSFFFPSLFKELGLLHPLKWPFILAAVITAANTGFCIHIHYLARTLSRKSIETNICLQIAADLLFVTAVVHQVGSTHSFIAFIYIFHIALACIFFSPAGSLLVTLGASGLYITTVILEMGGVIPRSSIIAGYPIPGTGKPFVIPSNAGAAVVVWIITWYLVSTLSKAVREQGKKLTLANKKLVEANREKAMQVLVTTHELKSPFSGIENYIRVLKSQYWADIPKPVCEIMNRIESKSYTLRKRIDEILILGNLKMKSGGDNRIVSIDIHEMIHSLLAALEDTISKKGVQCNTDIPHVLFSGNTEHLQLLFSNLIINAVVYSHEHGVIDISAVSRKETLHVYISDHGIGIREDALSHIFDEYYRTREGSKFNKMSTGLGLSIVKEIARSYMYGIKVKSELDKGTTFEIIIPETNYNNERG